MAMKIGYTGSRNGMTEAQRLAVTVCLASCGDIPRREFHDGDCIGGDAQAHAIAVQGKFRTVSHPCNIPAMRAYCPSDVVCAEKPPLVRNHDIVDETSVLIACPGTQHEITQSGTWSTIRYARQMLRPGRYIRIILPDGTLLTS